MATQNYFKAKNGLEAPSQSTITVTDSNFPTVRPTLNLDFAGSESVDSRISFTRASAATYIGADGKIKYAVQNEPRIEYDPITGECKGLLIEEQRTNLLSYSSEFDASSWSQQSIVTIPNVTTAPDGTCSADVLIPTTVFKTTHGVEQLMTLTTQTYTATIYVKPSGYTYFMFGIGGATSKGLYFDLTNLTVGGAWGAAGATATITNVGNGWIRIAMTVAATAGSGQGFIIRPFNNIAGNGFSGDGTSGVYVWGAQLEVGSFATSYIPSTTTFTSRASSATYFDSTGTLRIAGTNQARYGYGYDSTSGKWVSQGLLLEAAATNMYPYNNNNGYSGPAFTAYLKNSATRDYGVAPNGKTESIRYVDSGQGGYWYISGGVSQSFLIGSGSATVSVFMKVNAQSSTGSFSIGWPSNAGAVTISGTGTSVTVANSAGAINSTATYVGNSWWRISWVCPSAPWAQALEFQMANNTATGLDVELWGLQWEAGSVPTSYIPTLGATVTRAADVSSSAATTRSADTPSIAGNNFSSWFKYDEGSVAVNCSSYAVGSATWRSLFEFAQYTNPSGVRHSIGALSAGGVQAYLITPSPQVYGLQPSGAPFSTNAVATVGYSYKTNDTAVVANGSTAAVDTSCGMPTSIDYMYIGNDNEGRRLNGHIKKLTYYPFRLSNTQLQALTA